ncbi:hypothetical protein GCM10017774_42140 [Lentzea cavernae]|uniref:Uncharacterized protein n=1 Tax=Lentzea cavernae TaxID=2020703 RepID=A0ABQ3MQN4_9PSEU|nr:hypothetical protein GCM10017774_42140 [Lentzea cavernae]
MVQQLRTECLTHSSAWQWGQGHVGHHRERDVPHRANASRPTVATAPLNTSPLDRPTPEDSFASIPVPSPDRVAAAIVRLADRLRRHVSLPVGRANLLIISAFRSLPTT